LGGEKEGAWLRLGQPQFFKMTGYWNAVGTAAGLLGARARAAWTGQKSDGLWGLDRSFKMQPNEVRQAVALRKPGLQEFMFHPRSVEDQDTRCLVALRDLRAGS
jgi:hypothetical protein